MFARRRGASAEPEIQVVDNSAFLIALDDSYRRSMKPFESGELLECARSVAEALSVPPATGPVEGYYHESEALTEYFQWIQALRGAERNRESEIAHRPEFQRLLEVTSSPVFGRPRRYNLLPIGRDPLTQALADIPVDQWSVARLVEAARSIARSWDDYSLVGLAAWSGDPVVLAALRESVVLYSEPYATGMRSEPEYIWAVDQELVNQANRFIKAFNAFCPNKLERVPDPPVPSWLAMAFYKAYEHADIIGRCARIAIDPEAPEPNYHWAVCRGNTGETTVDAFWSKTLWTTQAYRNRRLFHSEMR